MYCRSYIIFLLFASSLFGQYRDIPDVVTKVATSAANWLKIESGARSIGMGGSQVASGIGVSAIPYNPSSISYLRGDQEVYYSKVNYLAGITHNTIAYGRKMSYSDYIGIHLFYLDSGPIGVTTLWDPDGTGEDYRVTNYAFRLVYARLMTDRLRIGGSIKYIREEIYTMSMQSFLADIGSNFDTGIAGIMLGMSVSNFGPDVQFHGQGLEVQVPDTISVDETLIRSTKEFPVPLVFRLGIKKDLIGAEEGSVHRLTTSIDAINPLDYILYFSTGAEYSWRDIGFFRAGTHIGHDTAGLSLGGGLKWSIFEVDYAYVNYGVLEETHQFGINLKF